MPWKKGNEFTLDCGSVGAQGIHWQVWFDVRKTWQEIRQSSSNVDRETAWLTWFRDWASKIVALTHQTVAEFNDGELPEMADTINIEFIARASGCDCQSQVCLIRDYVVIRYEDPLAVLDEWPVDAVGSRLPTNFRAIITADRDTWEQLETIHGTYRLENVGTRWACIRPIDLHEPELRSEDSRSLKAFDADYYVCRSSLTGFPPLVIMPGEHLEREFWIVTNPVSTSYGTLAPPGEFQIIYPRFSGRLRILLESVPVEIRVITIGSDRAIEKLDARPEGERKYQPPAVDDDTDLSSF